jgi:hypothetical protein
LLASALLREDLEPTEPFAVLGRVVAIVVGALGAAATLTFGPPSPPVIGTATALGLIGLVGVLPVRYALRASLRISAAVSGLVLALVWRVLEGDTPTAPLLSMSVVVLAAGLLFRSSYRASRSARWLTAGGIALSVLWVAISGSVDMLLAIGPEWQSFGPASMRVVVFVLLLLSLLAFMDEATTGACAVWGAALLMWYGLQEILELAVRTWPIAHATQTSSGLIAVFFGAGALNAPSPTMTAVTIATVLLVPNAAIALAELFAVAAGGTRAQRSGSA